MLGHAMDHDMEAAKPAASGARATESLLAILQRRYAQGEISGDQFAEMKRVLGIGAAPETTGVTANAWDGEHHG
jgi:uncharacterized membrane protein